MIKDGEIYSISVHFLARVSLRDFPASISAGVHAIALSVFINRVV